MSRFRLQLPKVSSTPWRWLQQKKKGRESREVRCEHTRTQEKWNLYYCTAAGYLMRQSWGLVIELRIIRRGLDNNAQPGRNRQCAVWAASFQKLSLFKKCFFLRKSEVLKSSRWVFRSSLTLTASQQTLTTNQLCRAATTCWWLLQFSTPNEKVIVSTLRGFSTCYHPHWGKNCWQPSSKI